MRSFDITEKRRKIILFTLTLTVSLGLAFFLGRSIRDSNPAEASPIIAGHTLSAAELDRLFASDDKLQDKVVLLQQLDKQYTAQMTDDKKSDSLDQSILQVEKDLRAAIEAVDEEGKALKDKPVQEKFAKMVSRYRQLLAGRSAGEGMRNAIALRLNDFSDNEKDLLKLQQELVQKNNRILMLEASAKPMATQTAVSLPNDQSELLNRKLAELEGTVNSYANVNTSLKQENEKLQKLQNENNRKNNSNEMMLKDKGVLLQQKVEALNAELQLAHVDCNLSRVDAAQIISNAKQRKQLLSEASSILTNLSMTGSDDLKKKVKDKIVRLNQVAANTRE